MSADDTRERFELLDWKRQIFALYQDVRGAEDPRRAWERWCSIRRALYEHHPQSPRRGTVPRYFDYEPELRVLADVRVHDGRTLEIAGSAGSRIAFTRFAEARFELLAAEHSLELYWLEAYGGGVFLPFVDATSGGQTYGGGRYLLDTVKGADLGEEGGRLVLDFNFAYNPSCAYDPRWACPLTPSGNRLGVPVRAGELAPG
jgi:uncharacterized protein (DUF1684 family)